MKLVFLQSNQRWVFVFGDTMIRLCPDSPAAPGYNQRQLFFEDKYSAVQVAEECGLSVFANGDVRPHLSRVKP